VWPTLSSSAARPPARRPRWVTSSVCAAPCATSLSWWAAVSRRRRRPSCCPLPMPSSSGPSSSATGTSISPSIPRACAASSRPSVVNRRARSLLSFLALVVALLTGCRSLVPDPAREALAADVGQLLLVGFDGTLGPGNVQPARLPCEARVGGVLLFGRNVVDAGQLRALTDWMRSRARECAGRRLLVATDAEGGRVMRLGPAAGYAATLSHQELGDANDFTMTELEARRIRRMLRAAGLAWDLAPVLA